MLPLSLIRDPCLYRKPDMIFVLIVAFIGSSAHLSNENFKVSGACTL